MVGNQRPDDSLKSDDGSLSALINLARAGCDRAQDDLFRQLRDYLGFVANQHLDSRLLAKLGPSDIVQQSMIRAIEQMPDYRGTTAAEFRGWLRQILINETKLARRAFAAHKRDVRREQSMAVADSQDQPLDLADGRLTPATHALADEQALFVRQLIERLPENHQTVIRLRNWEELSFEDISVRMNMSVSGVAKVWYRALVKLQELYQQDNESKKG